MCMWVHAYNMLGPVEVRCRFPLKLEVPEVELPQAGVGSQGWILQGSSVHHCTISPVLKLSLLKDTCLLTSARLSGR